MNINGLANTIVGYDFIQQLHTNLADIWHKRRIHKMMAADLKPTDVNFWKELWYNDREQYFKYLLNENVLNLLPEIHNPTYFSNWEQLFLSNFNILNTVPISTSDWVKRFIYYRFFNKHRFDNLIYFEGFCKWCASIAPAFEQTLISMEHCFDLFPDSLWKVILKNKQLTKSFLNKNLKYLMKPTLYYVLKSTQPEIFRCHPTVLNTINNYIQNQ